MMLHRILRRYYQKRLRQRQCSSINGNLRFVHRFQQRGLRSRRRSVDFVGQHHIREYRTMPKLKITRFGIVDAHAQDITRKKIAGELDPLKASSETTSPMPEPE